MLRAMLLTDAHLHFDTFAQAGEVDAILARPADDMTLVIVKFDR